MDQLVKRHTPLLLAVFGAILLLGWFAYSPALSGPFLLDDRANLEGLTYVDDLRSALQFLASGDAGPVGRPLALASFLPQAESMGSNPRPFLTFNVLLHLFNTCLVAGFLFSVNRTFKGVGHREAIFISLTAATIWLFMPLLASASLLIVQRMTTLSATFMLLGLIGYLRARRNIDTTPSLALIGMTVTLTVGTLLAVLTKENGALLPTLVLVLEMTLLRSPDSMHRKKWRLWLSIFLILPTALIVGFIVTRVPYADDLVLRRDFTGWERLLTQSRVLWEYLFNAFIPQPSRFGPFHDAYPIATSLLNPVTLVALAAWLIAIGLALLWRRQYPVFSFAVLWFIGAHLLESTLVPLELYFEHRNYVPIIGPLFALCFLVVRAPVSRKLVYVGLPLYAAVNAAALIGVTTLWGQPAVAAHFWHDRFPDSGRAASNLAQYYLAIHGEHRTLEAVEHFSNQLPDDGYMQIQQLLLSCAFDPDSDHRTIVEQVKVSVRNMQFTYSAASILSRLATTINKSECRDVDLNTVRDLSEEVMRNPRYNQSSRYKQLHHQTLAQIANLLGKHQEAIIHLERANTFRPDPLIHGKIVSVYTAIGQHDEARAFISATREHAPLSPLKRYEWLSNLDDLGRYIDAAEQESKSTQR